MDNQEEAAAVLAVMGLVVSDAVRLMLTKVVHDTKLPFEQLIPNDITIQAMKDGTAGKVTKAACVEALKHCVPTSMRAIDSTGQFKSSFKREKKIRHPGNT